MSSRDYIINQVIEREGGYIDDPSDSGGETNYGVTVAVARGAGYFGAMRDLPRSVAFDIYVERFWVTVNGDGLQMLSPDIAEEVVDTGVNMGPGRAARFLQRALNVFNQRGNLYDDITVDGQIGAATLTALRYYLQKREGAILLLALNCLQAAAYIDLAERREKDEKFIYGWLKNRVRLV